MAQIISAANTLTWPGALAVVVVAVACAVAACAVCWMLRELFT